MRVRLVLIAAVVLAAVGVFLAAPHVRDELDSGHATSALAAPTPRAGGVVGGVGSPAPSPAASRPPLGDVPVTPAPRAPVTSVTLSPRPVSVRGTVFFGWSLLNRQTGAVAGSGNRDSGTNSTESMIKAWIASDYLRRLDAAGRTPTATALHELTLMIIDSNDNMAQKYYVIDGGNAVVQRLISMCGLKETTVYNGWWSKTRMTPADAVRYGSCVASGKAAGKRWTPWILKTMTQVRGGVNYQQATTGGGRWGIIDALPVAMVTTTSIKNGWTAYQGVWHVNCMAIQKDWVLAVMMRYPSGDGLRFGANVCASVTRQLTDPPLARPGVERVNVR
jgi:hypothetical protein